MAQSPVKLAWAWGRAPEFRSGILAPWVLTQALAEGLRALQLGPGCWGETLSLRTVPLQAPRSMWYVSTRGTAPRVDFEGALFAGYAPDGGLFMPEELPRLGEETLRRWSALSYPSLVTELCALFIAPSSFQEMT